MKIHGKRDGTRALIEVVRARAEEPAKVGSERLPPILT